jgi:hypothetical protein
MLSFPQTLKSESKRNPNQTNNGLKGADQSEKITEA